MAAISPGLLREAQRLREYDRLMRAPWPHAMAFRWLMGPQAQYLTNSPLLRLPGNLKLDSSTRLLDLGCSRASLLRALDDQLRCDTPPVGLDFCRRALEVALADEDNPHRRAGFVQASASALPFRDGAFNLVTCGYVAKHLDDDALLALLVEVRRVLEPGGLALLWEFGPSGNPRLDAWNAAVIATAVREPRLRSVKTLTRFARDAGFDFVRDAALRPFLFPPIPRVSILVGRPPEGYRPVYTA
jgi:SAM-dependent methyltransferase